MGSALGALSQDLNLSGKVSDAESGKAIFAANIILQKTSFSALSGNNGEFTIKGISPGDYTIIVFFSGYKTYQEKIRIDADTQIDISLGKLKTELKNVIVTAEKDNSFGLTKLNNVENSAIYAGKKSEVIIMEDMTANMATNNSRQIYSKIAGLNIWESDAGGMQLGIGGRGLNPNRVSNFNTRQNGYDISADALGYPESYYSPPAEAVERIEIVRGAASLQYGTQFGGIINFKLKSGPSDKKIQLVSRQTAGSWGFLNTFNSIGGTVGKLNYYTCFQYKKGNGWRGNSEFNTKTSFTTATYSFSEAFKLTFDYTYMNYLAHQAGGLTDAQFAENPRSSSRERNWFSVDWNLYSVQLDYKFSEKVRVNNRFYGLLANRKALGFLGNINRVDHLQERDLLVDEFRNIGNETRLIYTYKTNGQFSNLLIGARYYNGFTNRMQGLANSNYGPEFHYLNPSDLENSHFRFPSSNYSLFGENVFQLTKKLNITPGIRYEYISTNSRGYYKETYKDMGNNIIYSSTNEEERSSDRSFFLAGLGLGHKYKDNAEIYINFSQNYRSINFNDMRIVNPNFRVDPDLKDETGYSADLGLRGNKDKVLHYDVSIFYLKYNDRIGSIQKLDSTTYTIYRLRTNVADSRNTGIEAFAEADIWKIARKKDTKIKLSVFSNISLINARYMDTEEKAYEGKKVEFVPDYMLKTGLNFRRNNLKISTQYAYTSSQFTDATNAEFTTNAVNGIVPAYYVIDISAEYSRKFWSLASGINNVTNNMYFTRRAEGYPGPGIIPSDGRSFYVTLQIKI
ncbi:MAG TPA: TonB-dependent receptor [Bacteroidia bacterium]|nr:TonB-dependent receptor [Bacteroidia bacterium]